MRIFISVDLEGVNGVVHSSQTQPGEPGYERAVQLMHRELEAVLEGIVAGGGTEIVVADAHWDGRNLRPELLPRDVTLISGWQRPFSMVAGVGSTLAGKNLVTGPFDGAFFLGYHARAGVACGVLSHTYRSQVFLSVSLNGKPVGEFGLNAALAGFFNVPIGFVSGDDAAIAEAEAFIGKNVTGVIVKQAISRYSAACLPIKESLERLRIGAQSAMNKRDYWDIYFPPKPSTLSISFFDPSMADAAELLPQVKRTGERDIEVSSEDYSELFRLFLAIGALGASRKDPYF